MKSKIVFLAILIILFGVVVLSSAFRSAQLVQLQSQAQKHNPTPTSKPVPLLCQLSSSLEKTNILIYVKGPSMRIKGLTLKTKDKGNALIRFNRVWFWEDASKEGTTFIFNRQSEQNSPFVIVNTDPNLIINRLLDMIETARNTCKLSPYPDTVFTIPRNVVFSNLKEQKK